MIEEKKEERRIMMVTVDCSVAMAEESYDTETKS